MTLRPAYVVLALTFALGLVACAKSGTESSTTPGTAAQAAKPGVEEAVQDAVQAYIYGYPLVTMDMTRKQLTNVPNGSAVSGRGPMGTMIRLRSYPAVDDHAVTAPNADTLYTMAWLDVSSEPWLFSIPDMGDRYYLMPMLDGWTDVFQVPGTRTTGGKAQTYAITGPGWSGTLPAGVTEYKSPTGLVWILGRIYCTGTSQDYAKVHALQDKFAVVPLSSYGKPYTPPPNEVDDNFDMKTGVREQVNSMSVEEYFSYLAKLLKANLPNAADTPMVATLARIGIVPGQEFDGSKLGAFDKEAIKTVPKLAQLKIIEYFRKVSAPVNGWMYLTQNIGEYGTDYVQRALVTAIGLGANRPKDAVYPTSDKDAAGDDYDGNKHYVMHFDKGQMPPAKAFWSLTMYDADYFFVPNALHRQTLSSRSKLVTNPDGSVDLYLQADSPGKGKEPNWLPAPKAKFIPMLRLYWPNETPPSIIDGSWKPPAIKVAQ
jgi:hypothetical protein